MTNAELYARWGHIFSPEMLEAMRTRMSGTFELHINDEVLLAPNLVTNEGLDYQLTAGIGGGAQITSWRCALVKSNTVPSEFMTYATPVYTEVIGADVQEANRQVYTPGATASQIITNSAAPAQYTIAQDLTAYGIALVGGGGSPEVIADVAGGGTLYSFGEFTQGERALVATDVIRLIYTLGSQAVP